MRKLWKMVNDLKIHTKLILSYVLIGFLPIIMLFFMFYSQMRTLIYEKEEATIRGYMTQAISTIEGRLAVYNNLSDYIAFSQGLAKVANSKYDSIYEMYEQISTQLDPVLQSLRYFHEEVEQVTIFSENCNVKHDTSLASLSEAEKEPWFDAAMQTFSSLWYIDAGQKLAVCARRLPLLDRMGTQGLLYIRVNYDSLFSSFVEIPRTDYALKIVDGGGINVYLYEGIEQKGEVVSFLEKAQDVDWDVLFYQPRSAYERVLKPMKKLAAASIIVCVAGALSLFWLVSKLLTRRILRLTAQMSEVENGNLEVEVSDSCEDELGILARGFETMLKQIRILIHEVYGSKLAQREYEMKALQNQINPHFLYNTLSMINWKAIEAQQKDISRVTLALSTYYRTALNKGRNVMKLQEEIRNVRSYLEIQLMMHDHSFDTEIDVAEEILDCESLNLILQPLAENAIEHGIDQMTAGRRGKILITGRLEDGCIVLTVEDNGYGMEQEKAQQILTKESKGYGVRNVNERIRLYYGAKYALRIESSPGCGTRCIICFPVRKYECNMTK